MLRFRFVVMGAVWITTFFLFLDRVNISLAAPHMMEEFGLRGIEMGLILSVYYWGYIVGHIGGGITADRYGVRKWASVVFGAWCVLTALTGTCRTLWQLGMVRGLFGVSEGAVANPLQKLENQWVLPQERGWVYGVLITSGYLGLIVGMPLVGWLINVWGWRMMFYGTGALTLLGVWLFWLLVYDHPREHPWVSEEEKCLIEETLAKDRVTFDPRQGAAQPLSFPEGVRMLVRNWVFWGVCGLGFFVTGVFFANLSWLPGYLVKERGYTVMSSGLSLIIPYLTASCGALSGGYLGDRTGNRSAVSLCAGLLTGPAMVGLMLSHEVTSTMLFMSAALFLNAAMANTLVILLFDLLPAEVLGMAMGIYIGCFGGLGGAVGPLILGYSYDHTGSFFWGFSGLGMGVTLMSFILVPIIFHERRVKREKAENAVLWNLPSTERKLNTMREGTA